MTGSSSPSSIRLGSHTRTHAGPETPARATTVSSSAPSPSSAGPRSGTDTARSRRPPAERVQTSARSSSIVFFSDSASWRSSSSSGSARVSRVPNVRSTSSGACRSPYTRRVAKSVSRSRAGTHSSAASAAASIERPSSERSSSVGSRPSPRTTSRYGRADEDDEPGEHDGVHEQTVDANRDIVRGADRERERHERSRAHGHREHRSGPVEEGVEDRRTRADGDRDRDAPRRPLEPAVAR